MKVCIVSDSHDQRHHLRTAVEQSRARGAELVLHCGDVVAAGTLRALEPLQLPVHVIHGNNLGDLYTLSKLANKPGGIIHYHGQDARLEFLGLRVFMVHFPHYARALALTGDWDFVCCGHDHKPYIEPTTNIKGTTTWVLNPGSVAGFDAPPTYLFGDFETRQFEICTL